MPGNAARRVEHLPLFVRLRGGCFHEKGWTFHAEADFAKSSVVFCQTDASGRVTGMEEPAWARHSNGDTEFVRLRPYADPVAAEQCLVLMCAHLAGAIAGRRKALGHFASGWLALLSHGIAAESLDNSAKVDAAASFYGRGRVHDALNACGSLKPLDALDPVAMVREALAGPEPLGVEILWRDRLAA